MEGAVHSFSGEGIENLNVMTFNVRGLRKRNKRLAILKTIKEEKIEITAMQETYLTEKELVLIEKEWGGKVVMSSGKTNSNGLVILISKKLSNIYEVKMVHREDRALFIKITDNNNKENALLLGNIYAPCNNQEKINFFGHLLQVSERLNMEHVGCPIIYAGDFNTVVDNKIDIIAGGAHDEKTVKELNNFIIKMNLADSWRIKHPSINMHTWSRGVPAIARRLDYIFIDENMIPFLQTSKIKTLGFSDHRAVITNFRFASFKRGKSRFKMNTSLLKDLEYVNLMKLRIRKCIEDNPELNPHLLWESIKIEIKETSQEYSRYKQFIRNVENGNMTEKLNEMEEQLAGNPNDAKIIAHILKLKQQLEIHKIHEAKGAQIRAGIKWIEQGEKCNKFFLALEKSRAISNTIVAVRDKQGQIVKDEHDILKITAQFYSDLYNEVKDPTITEKECEEFMDKVDTPKLETSERESCDKIITLSEVLISLKKTKNGSAPGSDGIPAEFYKVFWIDIKTPLFNCYKYSFEQGILTKSQRKGVMTLLHKGKGLSRDDLTNWRPIALTNVDYKLLSKTLAIRLKTVIDTLVDKDQKGFISGRNIGELLREIDDIIEHEKSEGTNSLLLSVDYRKAFDTISTVHINKVIELFGFGAYYSRWIKIILKDRLSCTTNGGYTSGDFRMERGVRQGCPISPLLFVLAVELLAISIRQDPNIKGITVGETVFLIKQYADDTTFFLKTTEDLKRVINRIKEFSKFSGLCLNTQKSQIMVLGKGFLSEEHTLGIKQATHIKILGIIFSTNISASENKDNWKDKIENIERMFSKWRHRNLSIIGKITIIKTFALSQLVYIMQSIAIPNEELEQINRIFFRFLWKRKYSNKRAFEKVKRKVMCNPSKEGGLNMINIQALQKSFLINWARKLGGGERENWKAIPLIFYRKVGGIKVFECNTQSKDFKGLKLINNKFWINVLKTWLDLPWEERSAELGMSEPWFNNTKLKYKGDTIYKSRLVMINIVTIGDLFSNNRIMKVEELKERYGKYNGIELDLNIILNAILKVKTNVGKGNASRMSKIQEITRKNIYNNIKGQGTFDHLKIFWNRKEAELNENHWMTPIRCTNEIRLRILQWKIIHNIYPTNILLQKMKISETKNCSYCSEIDYTEHFFFHCRMVKNVWKEIESTIEAGCGKSIKLGVIDVMLGVQGVDGINRKEMNWINHIILVGKMVVSKLKYGKHKYNLALLENELRIRQLSV